MKKAKITYFLVGAVLASALILVLVNRQWESGSTEQADDSQGQADSSGDGDRQARLQAADSEQFRQPVEGENGASLGGGKLDPSTLESFVVSIVDISGVPVASPVLICSTAEVVTQSVSSVFELALSEEVESHVLTITAPQFLRKTVAVAGKSLGESESIEIVLERGVTVHGLVRGPDGSPLPGAVCERLEVPAGFGEKPVYETLGVSSADGKFELAPVAFASHKLRVTHDFYPGLKLAIDASTGECEPFELTMFEGGTISGQVVGLPMSKVLVEVHASPRSRTGKASGSGLSQVARCSEDGRFELQKLPIKSGKGAYDLRVWIGEGYSRIQIAGPVRARSGAEGVQIEVSSTPVAMRVVEAVSGADLGDYALSLFAALGGTRQSYSVVVGGVRGSYTHVAMGQLTLESGGRLLIDVSKEGYMSKRMECSWGPGHGAIEVGLVELEPKHSLAVVVLDQEGGEPLKGAQVHLLSGGLNKDEMTRILGATTDPGSFESGHRFSKETDGEGKALFHVAPNASYHLAASHPEGGWLEPILVQPEDDQRVEVALSSGSEVEVRAVDSSGTGVPNIHIEMVYDVNEALSQVTRGEPLIRQLESDSNGYAMFENVPPGMNIFRAVVPGQVYEKQVWQSLNALPGGFEELSVLVASTVEAAGVVRLGGVPLAKATVTMIEEGRYRTDPSLNDVQWMHLGNFEARGRAVKSDHAGAFRFPNPLTRGPYRLKVYHPTLGSPFEVGVELVHENQVLQVDIASTSISGMIEDEHGQPISGGVVYLAAGPDLEAAVDSLIRATKGAKLSKWDKVVRADALGRFKFATVLPEASYTVLATAPEKSVYCETGLKVELHTSEPIRVTLVPSGSLEVIPTADRAIIDTVYGFRAVPLVESGNTCALVRYVSMHEWGLKKPLLLPHLAPGRWRIEFLSRIGAPSSVIVDIAAGEATKANVK